MDIFFSFINFISNFSDDNFIISFFIFFLFLLLYSLFSLPGLLIFIILSGYLFGPFYGFFVSIIPISLGSYFFSLFFKNLIKFIFSTSYEKYSKNINKYIPKSNFEYLIIFRMIPGPPLIMQNLILSLLNISAFKFIISTFLGFTPAILFSVIIGNKINNISSIQEVSSKDIFTWDFLIIIAMLILILIIRIAYKKKDPQ